MIIKEKSIKSYKNLENVLRYILSKEAEQGFVETRYIRGDRNFKKQLALHADDTEARSIVTEQRIQHMMGIYMRNDVLRIHKRQKETKFHHSILSFHKSDHITSEQLLKVYREFTRQRYPKSIVCCVSHHDRDHQHLHIIGSHVQYGTGITNYHTKKEFQAIKQHMELWQEQELGLVHSKVQHVKKKRKP